MEGLEPHTGAFEGQNRVCCSPTWGCTCGFVLESGQEEWGGKEKALVHSHAWPGMRLRCAPTCPLCSPKSPPAQMCGNLDLWNRIYGNCTSQSHAFNKNIACIFSGVKVKQVPPHPYSIWECPTYRPFVQFTRFIISLGVRLFDRNLFWPDIYNLCKQFSRDCMVWGLLIYSRAKKISIAALMSLGIWGTGKRELLVFIKMAKKLPCCPQFYL